METLGIICTAFYEEVRYRRIRRSGKLLRQRLFKLLDALDEAAGHDEAVEVATNAVRRATNECGWSLDSFSSLECQFELAQAQKLPLFSRLNPRNPGTYLFKDRDGILDVKCLARTEDGGLAEYDAYADYGLSVGAFQGLWMPLDDLIGEQ